MKKKYTIDELVTKRIKLTENEVHNFVFHLETFSDMYKQLRRQYPKIKEDDCFHDEIEMDFADLASLQLWGRTMMDNINKIIRKSYKGSNVVSRSKKYRKLRYSDKDGLQYKTPQGTWEKEDPLDVII